MSRADQNDPAPAGSGCAHHWIVESPSGETSKAKCKRCGEVRAFKNWPEVSTSPFRAKPVDRSPGKKPETGATT